MYKNNRFVYQDNQYWGEPLPCTPEIFNHFVDSPAVDWMISTRQAVEQAIEEGSALDRFTRISEFQKYCSKQLAKPRAGATFGSLSTAEKLQRWVSQLKSSLPCFVFAVSEFEARPVLDKLNNPEVDSEGNAKMKRRRTLQSIKRLSGLFIFDGDHLPFNPCEAYQRTQRPDFPWKVRLAHATSSGKGLRLVCEARPDIGNIADNQILLGKELMLYDVVGTTGKPVIDDSCIDASRISYCPRRKDIYFIDEENLFY